MSTSGCSGVSVSCSRTEHTSRVAASKMIMFGGGVVPQADVETLNAQGVGRIFGPGTDTRDIARYLNEEVNKRRTQQEA